MYPVAEGGVTCHATGGIKPQHRRIGLHGAQAFPPAKDLPEGGWLLLTALAISRESRIRPPGSVCFSNCPPMPGFHSTDRPTPFWISRSDRKTPPPPKSKNG